MEREAKIYRIACIVADGFTEGNEQYEEMSDIMKLRMTFAAENILRHFALTSKFPDKMPEFED